MSNWNDIINNKSNLKIADTKVYDLKRESQYTSKQNDSFHEFCPLKKPALIPLSSTKRFNRRAKSKIIMQHYEVHNDEIDGESGLIRNTNELIGETSADDTMPTYSSAPHYSSTSNENSSTKTSQNLFLIQYKKTKDNYGMANQLNGSHQVQKKREIYSLFLFIFFLFVTIITLSQILVMHNQTHNSNFFRIKLMQEELKLMDATIDTMLKEKRVLPMQVWYAMKQYNENLKRFSSFIDDVNSNTNIQNFNETEVTTRSNNFENLIEHLNQCEEFTKLQFKLLKTMRKIKSIRPMPDELIYKLLANLLQIVKTGNNSMNKIKNNLMSQKINAVLDKSLVIVDILQKNLNNSNEGLYQNTECINSINIGLFNLYSQQYTEFFESEPNFRNILVNKYDLINKTLTKYDSNISDTNSNGYFLKLPLRNMKSFYNRYQKNKSKYFSNEAMCNPQPPILYGRLNVIDIDAKHNITIDRVEKENSEVRIGGKWSPKCQARHKIAIIIPYRDRYEHLLVLLSYLHPLLQRQQLDYKIYVTEQYGNGTFNKAIIMNAAFIYAFDQDNYNCYCFHDVDMVPEDDRNMYSCGNNPKHMSISVNEMNYKLQYEELIGGVLILNTEHLIASNGYSNLFWGWGAEDDDLYYRLKGLNYKIERPPYKIGRYKMIKHQKRKPQLWSKRAKLLYSSVNRMTWDGISSANYTILKVTENKLFTHLMIDVGKPPPGFN